MREILKKKLHKENMIDKPVTKKAEGQLEQQFPVQSDALYNLYGKSTLKHWKVSELLIYLKDLS